MLRGVGKFGAKWVGKLERNIQQLHLDSKSTRGPTVVLLCHGCGPTVDDQKFLFYFHGIIKHENRDTLYAQLRWIGLGSGEDLQAPVDFKMHIPKRD